MTESERLDEHLRKEFGLEHIVRHPTAESVVRAYLAGWAEVGPEDDLASVQMGGISFGGRESTFTAAEMARAHEGAGMWGFADTERGEIHFWAEASTDASQLLHFFAHELEHLAVAQQPEETTRAEEPLPTEAQEAAAEERRCERTGRIAVAAWELAERFARGEGGDDA